MSRKIEERMKRFAQLKDGTGEFCVVCLELVGFPKAVHFSHPIRSWGGANYSDQGGGQTCGKCNRAILAAERNDGEMYE